MDILHRDDLPRGGFAGLREHRLVTDERLFGDHQSSGAWNGLGNFVYLADARFLPTGETGLHTHKEIDVISVMVEGRIQHAGSLEHGQEMDSHHVQAQRAGGEGFSHNEINPDTVENRMIQLWVLPEKPGQAAAYKLYRPVPGLLTRVYGGDSHQDDTFDSHTFIDVGLIKSGAGITLNQSFLAYITCGSGTINGQAVTEGDLVRDQDLVFSAETDTQLILIHCN